jgi:hypothetical protein
MELISKSYRMRGLASLLLKGSHRDLAKDLQRSATAWLHYLRHAKDEEKASAQADGLWCAIACQDLDTAAEIARSSRYTRNADLEYEDDFLYVAFLMRALVLGADRAEADDWVSKLDVFLQGEPSAKLDLCRALLARDEGAFDDALRRRIAEHRDWVAVMREREAFQDDEEATDAQVFLEGLALIRLAERNGMKPDEEYPLIPSMARRAKADGLGLDSWRNP